MDKIFRSVEALRLYDSVQNDPSSSGTLKRKDAGLSTKDRIHHCHIMGDSLMTTALKTHVDFTKAYAQVFEILFACCNDQDADVRLVADSTINRIVKHAILENSISRPQVEIYKEIKRNGQSRCLRTAVAKFADLVYLIKPQKCRIFAVSLVPCFVALARRPEDAVHECFATAALKLLPVLGKFFSDEEVRVMIKAFLPNLQIQSAACRRSAALSLTLLALHSRKQHVHSYYITKALLEALVPAQLDVSPQQLLGCLLTIKTMFEHNLLDLQHVDHAKSVLTHSGSAVSVRQPVLMTIDHYTCLYETALYYLCSNSPAVVTAALETLQQLLLKPPVLLKTALMSNKEPVSCSTFPPSSLHKWPILGKSTTLCSGFLGASTTSSLSGSQSDLTTFGGDVSLDVDDANVLNFDVSTMSDIPVGAPAAAQFAVSPSGDEDDVIIDSGVASTEYSSAALGVADSDTDETLVESTEPLRLTLSEGTMHSAPLELPTLSSRSLRIPDVPSEPTTPAASDVPIFPQNIGSFVDEDLPLKFCARMLCAKFLLTGQPGGLIADKDVRVSQKALALVCLRAIVNMHPQILRFSLHASAESSEPQQMLSDVLCYSKHADPQLRANTAELLGAFLAASFGLWLAADCDWVQPASTDLLSMDSSVGLLKTIMFDESAVACRSALAALRQGWSRIVAQDASAASQLFAAALTKAKNNYWLVKAELCEFLVEAHSSDLETGTTFLGTVFTSDRSELLSTVLDVLVDKLLADEDPRVQLSASAAIVSIVVFGKPNSTDATRQVECIDNVRLISQSGSGALPPIHGMQAPYTVMYQAPNLHAEKTLSYVLSRLMKTMLIAPDRQHVAGCVYAIAALVEALPPTVYRSTWCESRQPGDFCSVALCRMLLQYLTATPHILDFGIHQKCLDVIGWCMAGVAVSLLGKGGTELRVEKTAIASHSVLKQLFQDMLIYCLRILNLFWYVLSEVQPAVLSATAAAAIRQQLPNLPAAPTLSPVKRRISKSTSPDDAKATTNDSQTANAAAAPPSKQKVGDCAEIPQFAKLFELLRGSYANFKVSIETASPHKLSTLLGATLRCLCCMLEFAAYSDVSKYVEELLTYLKAVGFVAPAEALECSLQLLKALFGTNINLLQETLGGAGTFSADFSAHMRPTRVDCIYQNAVMKPYAQMTQRLAASLAKHDLIGEEIGRHLGWLRLKTDRYVMAMLKSGSGKTELTNFIRLFEPLVIQALKFYTTTSDTGVQSRVLQLLIQLIQVRVNYCLLDAELRFLNFVYQQFEALDENQIKDIAILVPSVFQFLVVLSYEQYQNKAIVSPSKMLQLCDSLIAVGVSPATLVIPALHIVVIDLWLLRPAAKIDNPRDIDTQKEVLVSVLMRYLQHHEAIELFAVILYQTKADSEEKWRKLSRDLVDVLFPGYLVKLLMNVDNMKACNVVCRVLDLVCPSAFRPVDFLLGIMFALPGPSLGGLEPFCRWAFMQLVCLRTLMLHTKEDALLTRVQQLECRTQFTSSIGCDIRKNEDYRLPDSASRTPQAHLARLFAICSATMAVEIRHYGTSLALPAQESSTDFLNALAYHYVELLCYLCQSGKFTKLTAAMRDTLCDDVSLVDQFVNLLPMQPAALVPWSHLCSLVAEKSYWRKVFDRLANKDSDLKRLVVVLFFDCLRTSNDQGVEIIIKQFAFDIVKLCDEPPVLEFIRSIQSKTALLAALSEGLQQLPDEQFKTPSEQRKLLHCLEVMSNLEILIPLLLKLFFEFLSDSAPLAIAKMASCILCKKVEQLLSNKLQASPCITAEQLSAYLRRFEDKIFRSRHHQAMVVLQKLQHFWFSNRHDIVWPDLADEATAQALGKEMHGKFNKMKFVHFLKSVRRSGLGTPTCIARMLQPFTYEEAAELLCNELADPEVLEACFRLGWNALQADLDRQGGSTSQAKCELSTTQYPLLAAARQAIFGCVKRFVNECPPDGLENCVPELLHSVRQLRKPVALLVTHLASVQPCSEQDLAALARFAALLLAVTERRCDALCMYETNRVLECAALVVTCPAVSLWLGLDAQTKLQRAIALSVCQLCETVLGRNVLDQCAVELPFQLPETYRALWLRYATLLKAWEDHALEKVLPTSLRSVMIFAILGVGRLPVVHSLCRTPDLAFKFGWTPEVKLSGDSDGAPQLPACPVHHLQHTEILKQFLRRLNAVGWCTRPQFEESWMNLLGVLSATPLLTEVSNAQAHETSERIVASSLAVRCLTALLLQTLLLPEPGFPPNIGGRYLLRHRDAPSQFLSTWSGQRLLYLKGRLRTLGDCCCAKRNCSLLFGANVERLVDWADYSCGQMSLETLWSWTGILAEEKRLLRTGGLTKARADVKQQSTTMEADLEPTGTVRRSTSNFLLLSDAGLDLVSSLHFLLDLYTHWLQMGASSVPLPLLSATVESMLLLSDIFTERAQYVWLRDRYRTIYQQHSIEDELTFQHIALGLLKSTAVLGVEEADVQRETLELLEACLENPQLSIRLAALHGALYLLQTLTPDQTLGIPVTLGNYVIAQMEKEFLPMEQQLLEKPQNLKHRLVVLSVGFHLLANFRTDLTNSMFAGQFLNLCSRAVQYTTDTTLSPVVRMAYEEGLQSLMVGGLFSDEKFVHQLTKLTTDSIRVSPDSRVTCASLLVLLACLYAGKSGGPVYEDRSPEQESLPISQDRHTSAMERLALFLTKLNSGVLDECRAMEAMLPCFLTDYFAPNQLMHKLIAELLNADERAHSARALERLLCHVVENMRELEALGTFCDWVMLAVPNFTHRATTWFAAWSLSCFLLSAANNHWVRAVVSFVESRYGELGPIDVTLFCFAVANFRAQLEDPSQIQSFSLTLRDAAAKFTNSPFSEALKHV